MTESLDSFLSAWTAAERAGDTTRLDALLTDDFYGVGPLGFVLPRPAWLGRHGPLAYRVFALGEVQTRMFDDVAVVTARNDTLGTYRGEPVPEAVRATLVIVREPTDWRLATIHMSFVAGTRGAPPIPGSAA